MTEKELALAVRKESKPTYKARIEDNKAVNNVANKGLKKGQVAIRKRNGEFHGIAVEVLEDIKPLLTDIRVAKAILFLSDNDIDSALLVLNLKQEVQKEQNHLGILYQVLKVWLEKNEFVVPQEYIKKARAVECSKIKAWVLRSRHQPIDVPLKIKSIGKSKAGHSVVPEEWLERVFKNAQHLHQEMDALDSRKGKAPVTFCCSYSMKIREDYCWQVSNEFLYNFVAQLAIEITYVNSKLKTQVHNFTSKEQYHLWLQKSRNTQYLPAITHQSLKIVVACDIRQVCRSPLYERCESVGLLVSTLQKAIRRGRGAVNLAVEVANKLAYSPSYSLPEYQFARVSGSRQLVWRLFITILEDVAPYEEKDDYLSLLDLACLAVLTHFDPNIQLIPAIIEKIVATIILVQNKDGEGQNWPWRNGKEKNVDLEQKAFGENRNENSMILALKTMPMMEGDRKLLLKSIDYLHKWPSKTLSSKKQLETHSCSKIAFETKRASYDMHCLPGLVLQVQANLPFIPHHLKNHTTKGLVKFIWDYSSSKNIRNKTVSCLNEEQSQILKTLQNTQEHLVCPTKYQFDFTKSRSKESCGKKPNTFENRIAFQMIFGQKVTLPTIGKFKSAEIVIAGSIKKPCKAKRKNMFLNGKQRFEAELQYIKYMTTDHQITIPTAPAGFKWIWENKNKVNIRVELQHSDSKNYENKILFFVEGISLSAFDATPILVSLNSVNHDQLPDDFEKIVEQSLYLIESDSKVNHKLRCIHHARKKAQNFNVYNWKQLALESPLPGVVWRNIIVKMHNNFNNEILIGPIDRNGKRLHDSISYLYEGTLLRIFNFLSFLYPECITIRGKYKFAINKNTSAYLHLQNCLNALAFAQQKILTTTSIAAPEITTNLWDHQQSASNEIAHGLINTGKKGYGDASNVGAGKTLTALAVLCKIFRHNTKKNNYRGFLVLLPTEKLYKTWKDEISKHTKNFHCVMQDANGKLNEQIQVNSIVITTLGRMRNHPLQNLWQLVVIDECLSVQNKNALQTEEAWRQVISSQYGVIMMSATFFRSRFDKLFYMLKMLRSGLPEQKVYLDTILSESIICHIPKESKKWVTTIRKFPLSLKMREKYTEIASENLSSQQVYIALSKYLHKHFDYLNCFALVISQLEKKEKALIYAKSKDEADNIARKIPNVSRYPDKTEKHVVVSYAEGTYGLNDLVAYNTIITRPPEPDKLPQMKGRLDRPGQEEQILQIKYLLAENTIDEAWLFRLEMANSFYKNHILPLATFYDIAVGRKKQPQSQ